MNYIDIIIQIVINALVVGIGIFIFQKWVTHKVQPLTAGEILKRENYLNSKRDLYYTAIELANREYAFIDFTDAQGNRSINYERDRGTLRPNEFEVNSCFTKLCIYSDNKTIPLLFKRIFLHTNQRPIQTLEDFTEALRLDLGYGKLNISKRADEYQYISIRRNDN